MIKVISGARRHNDVSASEFERRMLVEHAPLVARLPGLEHYVVNVAATEQGAPWDAVVELGFPDEAAFKSALASPAGQEVLSHMRTLVDVETIQSGTFRALDGVALRK